MHSNAPRTAPVVAKDIALITIEKYRMEWETSSVFANAATRRFAMNCQLLVALFHHFIIISQFRFLHHFMFAPDQGKVPVGSP
jgi:hypothetical protein